MPQDEEHPMPWPDGEPELDEFGPDDMPPDLEPRNHVPLDEAAAQDEPAVESGDWPAVEPAVTDNEFVAHGGPVITDTVSSPELVVDEPDTKPVEPADMESADAATVKPEQDEPEPVKTRGITRIERLRQRITLSSATVRHGLRQQREQETPGQADIVWPDATDEPEPEDSGQTVRGLGLQTPAEFDDPFGFFGGSHQQRTRQRRQQQPQQDTPAADAPQDDKLEAMAKELAEVKKMIVQLPSMLADMMRLG